MKWLTCFRIGMALVSEIEKAAKDRKITKGEIIKIVAGLLANIGISVIDAREGGKAEGSEIGSNWVAMIP